MKKWSFLLVALGSCFISACAGSTKFTGCEPAVCGVDCEPGQPCSGSLTLSPGASGTVKATLMVEGSHEGKFTFSVSGSGPVTATVSPASLDMVDGMPGDVTVTVSVDGTAMKGEFSANLSAQSEDGFGAGTSIGVTVP